MLTIKIKILLFVFLTLALNSCNSSEDNGIDVTITNFSSEPLANLEFTTTELLDSVRIDKVQVDKRVTGFLSMQRNKTDGAYSLTFTRADGKIENSISGYYSNGGPLNKRVEYKVENGTVLVEFSDY